LENRHVHAHGFGATARLPTATSVPVSKNKDDAAAQPGWYSRFQVNDQPQIYAIRDVAGELLQLRTTDAVAFDGEWHHHCWTYDGSNDASGFAYYFDGEAKALTIQGNGAHTGATASGNAFRLARRETATVRYVGGLADVRVYGRELSAEEVLTICTDEGADGIVDSLIIRLLADPGEASVGDTPAEIADYGTSGFAGTTTDDPVWIDSPLRGT